ncbi:MAG: RNA polymerase sigma factor [Planctomycetota bacterium]|nr:RNA polymerase sigma factor [Planctomycetota bacterium]
MRVDDGAIITAILEGRTDRFAELVDRHAPAVFRLIRAAIRHRQDVEDLAQEVFVAAFRSLGRLEDRARFRAYLLSITSRRIADVFRRKKRRGETLSLDHEPSAPDPSVGSDVMEAVESVVARLPSEARLIFALRHHEGLSCRRIGELVNSPSGTVYSRLSRVHAAIRRALEVNK